MIILGIETSCDETSAAIIEAKPKSKYINLLSNVTSSSLLLHAKTGGIIPEIAARKQVEYIIPVIEKALSDANTDFNNVDNIAVTVGPGLIGSLLVGVETAKTLGYFLNKPIVPVNHLIGHIYSNFIDQPSVDRRLKAVDFPAIALIVSGGHTDLVLMKNHNDLKLLGGTRDDAAGEAFDKIGRLLGMSYPAGPTIEKRAQNGTPKRFNFPRPMIDSGDFEFSFSGLKTAALREVRTMKQFASPTGGLNNETICDFSASLQQAIIDVLIKKTLKAAQKYNAKSILLGGGVAANSKLREDLKSSIVNLKSSIKLFVPTKSLCTDNGGMIASAAFFNHKPISWKKITANPELYFD